MTHLNRRSFIKTIGLGTVACVITTGLGCLLKSKRKPNIVFILVDDLGWADVGCYGSKYYETPNIDTLCNYGVKFTNGYAACAVCSPTRASIMTGRYPARIGITDWIHTDHRLAKQAIAERRNPEGFDSFQKLKLQTPINKLWLEHEEVTMAEVLKSQGYVTCHVGKWHLGYEDWYPDKQGFDYNIGGYEAGQPPGYFDPYTGKRGGQIPTLTPRKEGEYLTDRESDEAVVFIHKHKDQPFFLYMSHYAVHTPLQCKKELFKKYQDKPKTNQTSPTYAGMVESVDQAVGKIIQTLAELDLQENTVVIFTSDNGGASHVKIDGGKATDNSPLRQGKGFPYEGGIREPLVISWPGEIEAGSICDVPVSSIDFLPTICEVTGAKVPTDRVIDGLSLMPLLKQTGKLQREALFWHFPHYWWGGRIKPYSIIREGDWKLIRHYEDNVLELYYLKEDTGEQNNLVNQYAEKVQKLDATLSRWLKDVDAKLPKGNPDYKDS